MKPTPRMRDAWGVVHLRASGPYHFAFACRRGSGLAKPLRVASNDNAAITCLWCVAERNYHDRG